MPKGPRGERRPRDPIQLAKLVGDIATGQVEDKREPEKLAAAVELGRRGGLRGGRARAEKLSTERKAEIAQKAATARWSKPE